MQVKNTVPIRRNDQEITVKIKGELRNIYNLVKKVCNFNNVSSFDVNTTSYVDIKNEAKAMVNGGKNG